MVIALDDFPVQLRAQAFLLNVPHADGFKVCTDAQASHVYLKVRTHTNFQPGFLINAEIAHLDGPARVRQQLASGRVIQQCFLNGQRRSQLLAGNQHFSFRVLAPCIQQLVGKHGIRFYRFHGLNQIGLCARDFQGLRLLCFLSNHVRINKRQLFQ